MIDEAMICEFLRLKEGRLFHREGQELEFKEQFSLAGLADYFRDFAAFANNRGGLLIFGVKDAPRLPNGLSAGSLEQFNRIDPERITGFLLEIFSADIRWEQASFNIDGKHFGVFQVHEAPTKPIIAKKNEGRDLQIKNGEIYYRYGGRTQIIQYAELQNIIDHRVEQNNRQWLDLMAKIGRTGPENAAILDTERAVIEKDDAKILVVDENLASKLKFIKEGEFVEKRGATTLKLVGDVVPIEKVEVVRKIRENLTKQYPLSALELAAEVKKAIPAATSPQVWQIVRENGLKENPDYAAYNFRNKKQEDEFKSSGLLPAATPSIYNLRAVDYIVSVLQPTELN
ncbi:ATP-binding protein [Geomonas paludis]|uniref:ATP-binding protein n=1 Tax=Geomonas paludis TaxID=2740185 RepID=A0ABY4LI04_9BACT|nr:ATP-binding protein [Geomonas paludis]UPU37469.1 ATP-binding protein [Geomonas paludis]